MLLAKKKRNKNRPRLRSRPLIRVLLTTESENQLRNLYIQIPHCTEQNSSQMPGGWGRSCQQRSFLSEFDNLKIFVCFLRILLYADEIFYHDYLDLYWDTFK